MNVSTMEDPFPDETTDGESQAKKTPAAPE
jgi:hypothetical protein